MAEESITVTVEFEGKKITLQGPEPFVREELRRFTSSTSSEIQVDGGERKHQPKIVEKDFIAAKKPKNHSEIVACLAFCLTENGQPEFTEADIRKGYVRAGIRPPKVVSQAIRDAKNTRDFIEAGKKRGTYNLSHHGDRTVRFDLPHGGEKE